MLGEITGGAHVLTALLTVRTAAAAVAHHRYDEGPILCSSEPLMSQYEAVGSTRSFAIKTLDDLPVGAADPCSDHLYSDFSRAQLRGGDVVDPCVARTAGKDG